MEYQHLKCISPIDGRYKSKTEDLSQYFSELSLNKYRILIEIEYLISLGKLEIYDDLDNYSANNFATDDDIIVYNSWRENLLKIIFV